MSSVERKRITLGFMFVAVLGALLAWYLITRGSNTSTTGRAGTGRGSLSGVSESFVIDGTTTTPISPGISVPLDLGLTNPYDMTMSVTGVQVRIQTISAPNADSAYPCALGDFTVKQAAPASSVLTLAAGVRSSLGALGLPSTDWPRVGMLNRSVNQDGCKGASLTLTYSASGKTNP